MILYRGRQYVAQPSVELPSLDDVLQEYAAEVRSAARGWAEWHMDDYWSESEALDAAEKWITGEYKKLYDASVRRLLNADGADCWRALSLSQAVDPVAKNSLGVSWAQMRESAFPYWGDADSYVVYRGSIDASRIDGFATVVANTDTASGRREKEVRFHPGSPIYVYDVELPDGTVLPIEDWRRT